MESESPKGRDDGVRESLIGSSGGGAFERVTQSHAFMALANEHRFSTAQSPSLLLPGTIYEVDTPFARVKVMPGVNVEDAQALFAKLADPKNVNALAKLGKIGLTVGVRPRDRPRKGFTPIFRADKEKRTLSFVRDNEGRLLVITEGDTALHVARGIAKLQVDPPANVES
jgi:hypothetical protein